MILSSKQFLNFLSLTPLRIIGNRKAFSFNSFSISFNFLLGTGPHQLISCVRLDSYNLKYTYMRTHAYIHAVVTEMQL